MDLERVIVTGSTGFVGRSLVAQLDRTFQALHFGADDWRTEMETMAFTGATILHLAGRAHGGGTPEDFERDNVEKVRALAQAAAAKGARRIVVLSTIKVNGEETRGRPFTPEDAPAPEDEYGRSKWEAEKAVVAVASRSGIEYTIVRAPLIYGAGVRGNLFTLLRLADSKLPLPFAAIRNKRSFLHVDDLARLLIACASTSSAAGRIYLAANRSPVSTPRIVELMREQLQRPRRLFAVPPGALEAAALLTGQGERMRRLTRSLEVDPARAEEELEWSAQISIETSIEDMVSAYRAEAA